MSELVLKLTANGLILLIAVIGWGLENRWHDRRTKIRRRWARVLIVIVIIAAAVDSGVTWHTHGQEQEDRERLAGIEDGVATLVKLAREEDPTLTEQEALREVSAEIHTLRGRTSELERELEGVKRYSSVARLNMFGLKGEAGAGLKETSALSRLLEDAYVRKEDGGQVKFLARCDEKGTAAFHKAVETNPDFPFSYWGLALCAESFGHVEWGTHAAQGMTIFEHTTQIAGHHPHHDEALRQLRDLSAKR